MSSSPHSALLTGAGGGIGAAIAKAIAPQCAVLVLTGRDGPRLAATAQAVARPGLSCHTVQADLATAEGRAAVVKAAAAFDIDLLINNAGTSEFAWFVDQTDDAIERIVEVNVLAPMLLTRRLLPQLQRRQAGEAIDPIILDRVWAGLEQVRPAGVQVQLALGDDLLRGDLSTG